MSSFLIILLLAGIVLAGASVYIYQRRKFVDEMHGMMAGMGLGMMAGLLVATIFLLPTGNFLWGVIIGSIVGLLFGGVFGKLGGHLGIMEGVMAGPMGGMMGAMLGQMMRPFSLEIFMPFFMFIFVISLVGLTYAVHCGVSCCDGKNKEPAKVSSKFVIVWLIAGIVLIGSAAALTFSLSEKSAETRSTEIRLPTYLQQITQETRAEAVLKDGVQEVELVIENSAYSPNVIVVKQGVPLKINIDAKETAGCGSEIVIPDFKVKKIVAPGSTGVIELMPEKVGTFKFSCSMDMAKGKIIVQ